MFKWVLSLFRGKIVDDGEPLEELPVDEFRYLLKVTCGDKHYYTTIHTDRLDTTVEYTCARCKKLTHITHPGYLWVKPSTPSPTLNAPLLSWDGHSYRIEHWIYYNHTSTVQPDTYPRHYPNIPG